MPVISRPQAPSNSSSIAQAICHFINNAHTNIGIKLESPNGEFINNILSQLSQTSLLEKSQYVLSTQKRELTVEEGGPDTKNVKYVIAAVVVPFGLIFLAIFICVMRCRSQGKKARMAIEAAEKEKNNENNIFGIIRDDFASNLKISHTLKRSGDGENGGIGTNIEIKLVPKNDEANGYFSSKKNKILDDIAKSDSANLFEELRNNNYFNNYLDITQRKSTRVSVLSNEITNSQIIQPGSSMKKRMSEEMIIVNEMEEIDLSDSNLNGSRELYGPASKNLKKRAPQYSVIMKSEDLKSGRSSSILSSSNDEFYTPNEGSPNSNNDTVSKIQVKEAKVDDAGKMGKATEANLPSQNVTQINTKNTLLHRKLIDAQKECIYEFDEEEDEGINGNEEQDIVTNEIPSIPKLYKRPITASIYSNDTMTSNDTNQNSVITNVTKSTLATTMVSSPVMRSGSTGNYLQRIIESDSLKNKDSQAHIILEEDDDDTDKSSHDNNNPQKNFKYISPPSKPVLIKENVTEDLSRPEQTSVDEELLQKKRSSDLIDSEEANGVDFPQPNAAALQAEEEKRDSYLVRLSRSNFGSPNSKGENGAGAIYYDKYLEESDSDDSDYEVDRNDLVRLSVNLDTGSGSDSSFAGFGSSRSRYARSPGLEDLKELEEPIGSPKPNYQLNSISSVLNKSSEDLDDSIGSEKKPARKFLEEGKRDSTVTDADETNKVIDDQLTDTIKDINSFLKENGVYTSPVIIDTGNVVLGGLVISSDATTGITNINGKNFSTEDLNKHLSNDSSVNILLRNAVSNNCSPAICNSSIISPQIDSKLNSPAFGINNSASSSNYDLARRSLQSNKQLSPIAGSILNSPSLNHPRLHSPTMIGTAMSNKTSANITDVLAKTTHSPQFMKNSQSTRTPTQFEIINSPNIPKRSSKRSATTIYTLQFQNEEQPGIAGINAPVLTMGDNNYIAPLSPNHSPDPEFNSSSSNSSKSQARSSKALGINLKLRQKLSSPSIGINHIDETRTPEQIIRDKFYDSEESYSHTFDDDENHQNKYSKNQSRRSSGFVNPYTNMV
ncbi:hypothetical protein DASC09_024310 [Saccharomycopsis crataegensis]|uniref:Uncharacterized protein n=1 Tax=Saccharomycopsis crataegensis TaxID=43959 RepID=A0AAV5QKB7_9ASCO|nr:hypothetical protein DASC09_024310 [Saccharomycopsis crataegensis]